MVSDQFFKTGSWPDCLYHLDKIERHIHPNESDKLVVVDVGANIGACSLLFASKGCKVYAFEPVVHNFILLNKSIHDN